VIFAISPDSLTSEYCGLEVAHAVKNKKRLVPIVVRRPEDGTVPPHISHLNWIFFDNDATFDSAVANLVATVNEDQIEAQQRTRLLVRAREWENKGHNPSLLLRGIELHEAISLLTSADLTDLQREYLLASETRERVLQDIWRFVLGFIGGFIGMGIWTFSVFRSVDLVTPIRLIYTIALGQVFGVFIGLLALLAEDLPSVLTQRLKHGAQIALRLALTAGISLLAWVVFRWFYLQYPALETADINAILLGAAGLAAGFVLRILFRLPAWLATALTFVFSFLPVYITYQQWEAGSSNFVPLIYVDSAEQIFLTGLPIFLFVALGANAQALYQQARSLYRGLTAR
jgi:hypothetical protein